MALVLVLGGAAVAILLIRSAIPAAADYVTVIAACAFLLPWLWAPRLLRQSRSERWISGRLDQLAGGKGWYFAAASRDWDQHHLPELVFAEPPALRWAPLRLPIFACCGLLLVLLIPQVQIPDEPVLRLPPAQLARVEQRLKQLEEEALLPPEEIEQMRQELQQLQSEDASFDGSAWQSLDRLAQRMEAQAEDQAQRLGAAQSAVSQLAATSQNAQGAGNGPQGETDSSASQQQFGDSSQPGASAASPNQLQQQQLAAASAQMTQALAELAQANGAQADALRQGLAGIDPASMEAWQNALQQAVEQGALSAQQLAQLQEQGWPPNGQSAGQSEAATAQVSKVAKMAA